MSADRFLLRACRWLAVLSCLAALVLPAMAAERIKLATLAPTGSSFHKSLLNLREAWKKASNGGVELVVYADGKLGGEADTVGLMGVNSIQAAMLTGVGLSEIEPAVAGLQTIPMGFHSLAEVDHVGGSQRRALWCCSGPTPVGSAFSRRSR
jgi:TRAP-type C4-dicarboxylate transport system substrate-binding protein